MDIIKLAKPYVFEGTEYGEIDLNGLDKLTVQDAIDAQLALTGPAGRGDPAGEKHGLHCKTVRQGGGTAH